MADFSNLKKGDLLKAVRYNRVSEAHSGAARMRDMRTDDLLLVMETPGDRPPWEPFDPYVRCCLNGELVDVHEIVINRDLVWVQDAG